MTAAGFLNGYLNGPLPHVRCHITVPSCYSESVAHEMAAAGFLNGYLYVPYHMSDAI